MQCINLLSTGAGAGAGPMADISKPGSEKNIESSETSGIDGVDEWPPKLDRNMGVTFNDAGFCALL